MKDASLSELLAEHPFTADVSDEERQMLANLATIRVYEPDELLITEGRPATAFYLVVDGLVALELFVPGSGVRRLQTVEGGSAVGWSWMLAPYRWEFDARALQQTNVIVMDADRLRALLDRECCLGLHVVRKLLGVVAERLKATRLQLLDVYGPPTEVRQ